MPIQNFSSVKNLAIKFFNNKLSVGLLTVSIISVLIIQTFATFNTQSVTFEAAAATALNTNYSAATYLGGALESDRMGGIAIQPDKTIVWAGRIGGNDFGKTAVNIDGGGNGVILRLSSNGQSVLSVTRVGDYVEDVDVDRTTGNILAQTNVGVYSINSTGTSMNWKDNFGSVAVGKQENGRRIAVAQDGTIVATTSKAVKSYQSDGTVIGTFNEPGMRIQDLVIDSINQTIFISGDTQKDGGPCSQLRMAFIHTYSYTGTAKWTAYDWTHAEAAARNNSCPDTEIRRMALGEDGNLYFSGVSAGGGSIFRYKPQDLNQNAPNVEYDQYNTPYNIQGASNIMYFAKLDPSNGNIIHGQHSLSRLGNQGKGNTNNPLGISADANGRVYLLISAAYLFADRESVTSNGVAPGVYNGDNVLMVVSPDFSARERISVLDNEKTGTTSYVTTEDRIGDAVAVRSGVVAYGGRLVTDLIHTFSAVQPDKASPIDNYIAVLSEDQQSTSSSSSSSTAVSSQVSSSSSQISSALSSTTSSVVSSTQTSTPVSSSQATSTPALSSSAISSTVQSSVDSSSQAQTVSSVSSIISSSAQSLNSSVSSSISSLPVSSSSAISSTVASSALSAISSASSQVISQPSSASSSLVPSNPSSSAQSLSSSSQPIVSSSINTSTVNTSLSANSSTSSNTSSSNSVSSLNSQLSSISSSSSVNSSSTSSKPRFNLNQTITITIGPIRYVNGTVAANINFQLRITTPSGKIVVIRSRTDSAGMATISLTPTKLANNFTDMFSVKVMAETFPAQIISGSIEDLTELGTYTATVTTDDSGTISFEPLNVSWDVTNPETTLARTGGSTLLLSLISILGFACALFVVAKNSSQKSAKKN